MIKYLKMKENRNLLLIKIKEMNIENFELINLLIKVWGFAIKHLKFKQKTKLQQTYISRSNHGPNPYPPALPHKMLSLRGPGTSNIVIENFCLSGPHPGDAQATIMASLTPLLRSGVTTFVCLQNDLAIEGRDALVLHRSNYHGLVKSGVL